LVSPSPLGEKVGMRGKGVLRFTTLTPALFQGEREITW